jgi:hypothetical protein
MPSWQIFYYYVMLLSDGRSIFTLELWERFKAKLVKLNRWSTVER